MRYTLSQILYAIGFRWAIAPGRGGAGKQVGEFNDSAPLAGRGVIELRSRYGLELFPTIGSFGGEGENYDPASVISVWLNASGEHGGRAFLERERARGGLSSLGEGWTIVPPDSDTSHDLRYISRDRQQTAAHELIAEWLKFTNGGQDPDELGPRTPGAEPGELAALRVEVAALRIDLAAEALNIKIQLGALAEQLKRK